MIILGIYLLVSWALGAYYLTVTNKYRSVTDIPIVSWLQMLVIFPLIAWIMLLMMAAFYLLIGTINLLERIDILFDR